MTTNYKFKFIDLFAGIGGIRLGFEQGFNHNTEFVFASEVNKYSCQTYQTNFNHKPDGDITTISETEIPSFDVLLAGFPCQPFSQAGLKLGFNDSRGTLFFDIARIVKHHQPKVVFLENVKGFRNHDKGRTFQVVKNTLEELGYVVYQTVLNAKDFGVPQNRERIYIVAFSDRQINFKFPTGLKTTTRLGDILEDTPTEKHTISDRLWAGHQRRKLEHIEKGNGFGYSLFNHESSYTSTISARYYKDGSEILIEQPGKNPRKLTVREAARLQGFPDTFEIPVSDSQAYRQFGNSVAVPVVSAIAKQIYQALTIKQK